MSLNLSEIRRDFHRHPEIAFEEKRTSRIICEHLKSIGLEPKLCAGTGVTAELSGAQAGPTIAFRVDIDALPIEEITNAEYASKIQGKMHACGHDLHAAIGLGVAEALIKRQEELCGNIKFLFQPAEEVLSGAKAMIAEGILEGVSAIFGFHNKPELPVKSAAFTQGSVMAASDRFKIMIEGMGGHGAAPHKTKDPVVASAGIIMGLQTAVSRILDPTEPVVVSICSLHGGSAFNVIPHNVELEGTVRYLSPLIGRVMPGILADISANIAKGYRCSAKLEYTELVVPLVNSPELSDLAKRTAVKVLGKEAVVLSEPIMASEDFSEYLKYVPGCYFWLGSGGEHGFHHPAYCVDERCMDVGVNVLTEILVEALKQG